MRVNVGCCLSCLDQSSGNEAGLWCKQMIIRQIKNVQRREHILAQMQMSDILFLSSFFRVKTIFFVYREEKKNYRNNTYDDAKECANIYVSLFKQTDPITRGKISN